MTINDPITQLQAELDFWRMHVLDVLYVDEEAVLLNSDKVSSFMEELDKEHNFMWDNPSPETIAKGKAAMVAICSYLRMMGVHVHMKQSYLDLK